MKITKSQLKRIIKEELKNVLNEAAPPFPEDDPGGYTYPPGSYMDPQFEEYEDPDSDEDDAEELRDIADDLETKSPYAAEYERKRSGRSEIADQIRVLSSKLKELDSSSEEYWSVKREIEDLQDAMIDVGDRGGWN